MYRSLLLVPLLVVGLAGPASADPIRDLLDGDWSLAKLPRVCVDLSRDDPMIKTNLSEAEVEVNPEGEPNVWLSEGECTE